MYKATRTGNADFLKAEAARERFAVSHHTLEKLAEAANAKHRFGRSVFYDADRIAEFIRQQDA